MVTWRKIIHCLVPQVVSAPTTAHDGQDPPPGPHGQQPGVAQQQPVPVFRRGSIPLSPNPARNSGEMKTLMGAVSFGNIGSFSRHSSGASFAPPQVLRASGGPQGRAPPPRGGTGATTTPATTTSTNAPYYGSSLPPRMPSANSSLLSNASADRDRSGGGLSGGSGSGPPGGIGVARGSTGLLLRPTSLMSPVQLPTFQGGQSFFPLPTFRAGSDQSMQSSVEGVEVVEHHA